MTLMHCHQGIIGSANMPEEELRKISVVLNIMLLKQNITFEQPETYVKDFADSNVKYKDENLILYKKDKVPTNPSWYELFNEKIWDNRTEIDINRTSSDGLSLIKKLTYNNKIYVFVLNFNTGRYNINPKIIDKNFGLYTAQKMILSGDAQLKNTSIRSLEENPINKNVAFGEEINATTYQTNLEPNDYVRELNISVNNSETFKKMIGKNGSLNVRILFEENEIPCIDHLDNKLIDIIKIYESITADEINLLYKGLRPLEDDAFEELELALDEKISGFNSSHDGFYLFEPESDFDFSRIQKYEFKICTIENNRKRIDRFEENEFNLDKYLAYRQEPTLENLKNDSIKFIDENDFSKEWSIYECLYGEMEYNNRVYILSTEKWFEIEKNKFKRINNDIRAIQDDTFTVTTNLKVQVASEIKNIKLNEPNIKKIDKERIFNRKLCEEKNGELFDEIAKQIKIEDDAFEVCDVYLPQEKEFIHSKIKNGSSASALGHLFNQAYVSGYSYVRFKNAFVEKVNNLIADSKKHITQIHGDYTIRLLIINTSRTNKLSFFAKIILDEKIAQLKGYGYTVKLTWINGIDLNPEV